MEMSENIYSNSDFCTGKEKTDLNDSLNLYEDIYQNEDDLEDQETKSQEGTKTTESGTNRSRRCLIAVVCLVLLCVLLLGAIGGFWIYFTNLSTQIEKLQTSYNNLTINNEKLQTSYNNLTINNEKLQTSYNNLNINNERLQTSYNNLNINNEKLQTSYNNLTLNSEQLQARHNELITERERLQRRLSDVEIAINKLGWIYFSSSIYYISTEKKSWSESRQNCKNKGADLVIINTREEQEFVYSWSRGVRVWIGLTDSAKEGTWKWVDDTAPTTTFWGKSEPNNIGDEDCALIESTSEPVHNWADYPCNIPFVWMCEKKI